MKEAVQSAAVATLAPKVFRAFRWSWVVYGVAAYYGLKLLNKRGIFPNQTGAILNVIDHGIASAKRQVGLESGASSRGDSTHLTRKKDDISSAPMVH